MNCREIEPLLFAERDGALANNQRTDLDRHVGECAACRQLRSDLAAAAESWRAHTASVKVPDADSEWRKLRAELHGAEVRTSPNRRIAPIVWLATPLAAAAAIVLTFFLQSTPTPEIEAMARAEYVESGSAEASTMVFADKESGWLVVWAADPKTRG